MLSVAEEAALGPAGPREGLSVPSTAARVMPAGFSTTWCRFLAASALLPCAAHPAPPPCGRAVQLQALTTFTLCHSVLVGEGLCQGVPRAEPGPEALRHYGEGVQMGSLGRLLQCAVSLSVPPPAPPRHGPAGAAILHLGSLSRQCGGFPSAAGRAPSFYCCHLVAVR